MKNLKLILVLLSLHLINFSFGQNKEIYFINFTLSHLKRIPDNYVTVSFKHIKNIVKVFAKSTPSDTISSEWKSSKKEYSFELPLAEYEKIVSSILKISYSDIKNDLGFSGFDGTICKIEIGGVVNSISHQVWSPDYQTKERKLEDFLNICKLILITAKLNPTKIL